MRSQMSALHQIPLETLIPFDVAPHIKRRWLNIALWAIFDLTKDESIKLSIFKVPISFKVSKLEPLILRWVGVRRAE